MKVQGWVNPPFDREKKMGVPDPEAIYEVYEYESRWIVSFSYRAGPSRYWPY